MMDAPGSGDGFTARLNRNSESAAAELDYRYRRWLCALVAREMGQRFRGREDPEDVIQSALRSFFRGAARQRFQIDHSGGLGEALVTITRYKLLKHVEHHDAEKRRPAREAGNVEQVQALGDEDVVAAAEVADLIQTILVGLQPPDPEVFRLCLEGHSINEIAERVQCTRASVRYKLDRIRQRLRMIMHGKRPF